MAPKSLVHKETVLQRIKRINQELRSYREDRTSMDALIRYRRAMVDVIPRSWDVHYRRYGEVDDGIVLSVRRLIYANEGQHVYIVLNFARPSRPLSILAETDGISEKIPPLPTKTIIPELDALEKIWAEAKNRADVSDVKEPA